MRTDHKQRYVEFVGWASPRLLSTAWLLTGDPHQAEELVQESLARIYAKWRRVRQGEELRYARRVLANLHTDTWRKRRREVLSAEPAEPVTTDAGRGDASASRHVDLVRALQQLPPRERQVVVLRYYADLPESDVADALGVSLGTVKSSASRGLGRLREVMTEGDDSHVDF